MEDVSNKFVVKIKTLISFPVHYFSRHFCHLWDNVEKYGRAWQTTDDM